MNNTSEKPMSSDSKTRYLTEYGHYLLAFLVITFLILKFTQLPVIFTLILLAVIAFVFVVMIMQARFNKFAKKALPNADIKTTQIHLDSNERKIAYLSSTIVDGHLNMGVKGIDEIEHIELWISKKIETDTSNNNRTKKVTTHATIHFSDGNKCQVSTNVSRFNLTQRGSYKELSRLLSQISALRGECLIESNGGNL